MEIIGVKFKENYNRKCYDSDTFYYRNTGDSLEIGDAVIVETRYGIALAMVVEKPKAYEPNATKEIIMKLDLSNYLDKKKKEIRLKSIKAQLDEAAAKLCEVNKYDELAKLNPNYAELVNEYKTAINANNILQLNEINISNEDLLLNNIEQLNE